MISFDFFNPVRVIFGQGKLEELATIDLPGKKALIITTPDRLFLDRVVTLLQKNGVSSEIYDKVRPNPNSLGVMEAARFGLEKGCDFVVSIGGGSSTDTAKATAAIMKNGGELWDYMGGFTGELKPADKGALPIVVISTTSGTGTEVNQYAVITKDETFEKIDLVSESIFPTISILDPCLQTSVPKNLTAFQGMDVIYHSSEGFITKYATPIGDVCSLESLRLAAKHLPEAYRNGDNIEAREGVCLACLFAGYNESTAACVSLHAISHSFGAMHPLIPHGAALSLVAVECFKYYMQFVPERMAIMSETVGYGHRPEGFIEFLEDILKELGIDNIDYHEYGLDADRAEEYAQNSYDVTQCLHDCDVHLMPLEDCVEIIRKSLK